MALTTTRLSNGGYVETWSSGDPSGYSQKIHAQVFDAGGTKVGAEFSRQFSGGAWGVNPLSDGGYVLNFAWWPGMGSTVRYVHVMSSQGVLEQSSNYDASELSVLASPTGGFMVAWLLNQGYSTNPRFGIVALHDDNGAFVAGATTANPSVSLSLQPDGDFLVNGSVEIDAENPVRLIGPGKPEITVLDDQGRYTGVVPNEGLTDDANPTLRVTVTEPGGVRLYFNGSYHDQGQSQTFTVTADDAARGYVDIVLPRTVPDTYVTARRIDADGFIGTRAETRFFVDTTAPGATSVSRVLDNEGPAMGDVPAGGRTDDSTPSVQFALGGAKAEPGDTLHVTLDGQAMGPPVIITSEDVAKGYVQVTPAPLAAGQHSFSGQLIDKAGNAGPAGQSFTLTVGPDGGTPPPTGNPPGAVRTTDGGYVEHYVLNSELHVQKYDAGGAKVGPEFVTPAEQSQSVLALSDAGYVVSTFTQYFSSAGSRAFVFDASGGREASLTIPGVSSMAASPKGGFAASYYEPAYRGDTDGPEPYLVIYDNAGQLISKSGPYHASGAQTLTVQADGDYLLTWPEGNATRTLEVDPTRPPRLDTPATSTLTFIDDVEPNTGPVSGMTNDPTPILRLSVSEPGTMFIDWSGSHVIYGTGAAYAVTAEDAARGYKDIQAPQKSTVGEYALNYQFVDTDGVETGWTRASINIDAVAPNAGSIQKAIDNQGPVTGDVASGGATDDVTPTLRVSLSGVDASTMQLWDNGTKLGAAIPLTSADFSRGYVEITPDVLPAGSHAFTVNFTDAYANTGPASPAFNLTIQSGNEPPPGSGGQGVVLTSRRPDDTLVGGGGDDTLNASRGSDVLTGNGGRDVFAWGQEPWSPATVTDFAVGSDRLDLSKVFQAAGYTGTDPVGDKRIILQGQGSDTLVLFDDDGQGGDWPNYIIKLQGVSSTGLTWGQLSGAGGGTGSPGGPGGGSGQVLTSDQYGDSLVGGTGNDTLNAGQGPDMLTGGGGGDAFVYAKLPWNAGHATDFAVGADRLDLSALFQASGYTGANPIADGYVKLEGDGAGGTKVFYDTDGPASGNTIQFLITTLDGVSPAGLTWAQLSGGGGSQPPPPPPAGDGQVLTWRQHGDTLSGGAGNDTINASQGPDRLTGAAGADHFVYAKPPWSAGTITDFTPGSDKIDISALLDAYTGSDPIRDGWMRLDASGSDTRLYVDIDGPGGGEWPFLIATLQGVQPGSLSAGDWIA
jgi:Ca2+-binding RTX toxin-like protein